ncbi:MAG: 1,4-alpha-glucan branching protein GlgB [Flaviflexus sp.]|nr:1,4-alpha-glucan branching protein GlgB [Flaviflexus sp.]
MSPTPPVPAVPTEVLAAVAEGRYHAPHDVLGPHMSDGKVTIRVVRHLAETVTIRTEAGDVEAEHEYGGIWRATLAAETVPDYRVLARYSEQVEALTDDPYRFLPTVGELDLYLFGEGRHEELWRVLGAHVKHYESVLGDVDGTAFSVWAPNARAVRVVGDFNQWDGRSSAMRTLGSSGVWELFLPGASCGDRYKFEIQYQDGSWHQKADPMARRTEIPPSTASIITDSDYAWEDGQWMGERRDTDPLTGPISVYEVHLASWRQGLNFKELAAQLIGHVKYLGFTHVEFMPVAEHPFGGSWGYQVTSYYAPTSRFGSPDEFRYLVNELHKAGIGVIMDWVPAHFPKDSWALARFDGTPLYEDPDPLRGEHPDWGTYVFNYGRREVRNFLVANALYWLEEFHIDGIRVDAVASMLYLDYSREAGQWTPNIYGGRENLDAIAFLQETNATAYRRNPGILMIAEESTSWPGVTAMTDGGGLGFGLKWNMGWMNDTLHYLAEEPINRRYHHGEITFSLVYAFSEQFLLPISHDEVVHGKGSLYRKMPGDHWQKLAGMRALFAYQWAHPGKQLLFMGQEFGQIEEWNEAKGLDWHLTEQPDHDGLMALVAHLNQVYTSRPALFTDDFTNHGFEWIEVSDGDHNVLSFVRKSADEQDWLVAIINFAGIPHEDYRVGLPFGGVWEEIVNTDAEAYGGSGVGNLGQVTAEEVPWNGRAHSVSLRLPPLGALYLAPKRD